MSRRRKRFGFVIALLTVLPLLFCSSCSSDNDVAPDSPAYAYLEVFISMVGEINEAPIEYIGIDATKTLYAQPSDVKKLLEDYASTYGVSIRWNIKQNRCGSNFFSKGWLIIFEDIELTETKLETTATWMGAVSRAAYSVTFVIERESEGWTFINGHLNWIS